MTYNYRGRPEHLCAGANEAILLRSTAHIGYVCKHPGLHAKLDGPGNYSSNYLTREHRPRRNLHVMTKFEVGSELKCLVHRDVSPSLEQHHGERTAGYGVADNQFGDDIETDLLVGDRLDHTNGNDITEGDQKGQHETPDRELGWPNLDDDDSKYEHDHENTHVPPFGDTGVLGHETRMDVRLLVKRSARLSPNLFAEEQNSMDDCSGDGCERKAICKCKCCRQEQRAIVLISSEVKSISRCEDLCHIVLRTSVVVRNS